MSISLNASRKCLSFMTTHPPNRLYRVTGIRFNNFRVPMGFGLTHLEADRICDALAATGVFRSVQVETDTDSGAMQPDRPTRQE